MMMIVGGIIAACLIAWVQSEGCLEFQNSTECIDKDGCFWKNEVADEPDMIAGSCMLCSMYDTNPYACGLTGDRACKYSSDTQKCIQTETVRVTPGANPGIEDIVTDTKAQWVVATFSNLFVQELDQYTKDIQTAAFQEILLETLQSEFLSQDSMSSINADTVPEQPLCGETSTYVPWSVDETQCDLHASLGRSSCCVETSPEVYLARSQRAIGVNAPFCENDSLNCQVIDRTKLLVSMAVYPDTTEACDGSICGCIGKFYFYKIHANTNKKLQGILIVFHSTISKRPGAFVTIVSFLIVRLLPPSVLQ